VIRVLVIEDDPVANDAHAAYVARVPGFVVGGQAHTAADALRMLAKAQIDLVLLDMHLPDMHGLSIVRAMRSAGHTADVIAVTSARDLAIVRAAVSQGVVQYLLKPFIFAALRDKLERYLTYHDQLTAQHPVTAQHEVDRLLTTLRGADPVDLPKGLTRESLDAIAALLKAAGTGTGMSAAEAAQAMGVSRVTARRYLEYLAEVGLALRHARYRRSGRPEFEFRWVHDRPSSATAPPV
jgi:response regulator of citrate/malate metabolism